MSPPPVRHVSTVAPNRQTSCETFPEHQLYCDNSHRYQTALCYKHNISSAQMVYRLVPPVLSGTQHQHLETQEQPVNTVQECLWFSVVFPGFHAFFFSRLLKGIQKSHWIRTCHYSLKHCLESLYAVLMKVFMCRLFLYQQSSSSVNYLQMAIDPTVRLHTFQIFHQWVVNKISFTSTARR